jgi:CHASE2 domain-containing sensor protein
MWLGEGLVCWSYDLLFWFRTTQSPNEVVIVYMDDRSFVELSQKSFPNWDRNLHAQLLERLTADQCKLVVFDIVFSEPGTPEANANLARAMRRNGKVVLAASLDYPSRSQIRVMTKSMPQPELQDAAVGWGIAEVDVEHSPGRVARRYYAGVETEPSLPSAAAVVAGAKSTRGSEADLWLNYYGPALTLPFISYCDVVAMPSGHFRDKFVFVGARPKTLRAQDEADQFRTPHTRWTDTPAPGVEITATAFLNLLRSDGLVRLALAKEVWLVLVAGLVLGGGLSLVRPLAASGLALAAVAVMVFAAARAAQQHVWFAWTVVALAQIPCALAWSVGCHFHRMKFQKEVAERTLVETSRWAEAAATQARPHGLSIPDHSLVRCVGKGAYGEVWLARNAIGAFHAVKIVQRREFPSDAPYEREFRGIQKFMPISRSHPGFVHVLHVGRNDTMGFFFYIMEACDDASSGQRIDPERYSPKTLATELAWRGKLPPEECLQLGLSLTLALEQLHEHQLIHRDIKPGNIIYVHDTPKFADIGLVTDIGTPGQDVSCLGTEGYIPPEGPGTPAADVYALGKVLYEASMGRDRRLFPEVPTAVLEQRADALLRQINDVIGKACETNARERYQRAKEVYADLLKLQRSISQPKA